MKLTKRGMGRKIEGTPTVNRNHSHDKDRLGKAFYYDLYTGGRLVSTGRTGVVEGQTKPTKIIPCWMRSSLAHASVSKVSFTNSRTPDATLSAYMPIPCVA